MTKTILITGATDGLGRATALALANQGHKIIAHGRNAQKLDELKAEIGANLSTVQADMSDLAQVAQMSRDLTKVHDRIDVVINNAGVFKTSQPRLGDGMDVRFIVNTFAPALLSTLLLPIVPKDGRLVHLSSAAQAPVDVDAMKGKRQLQDMEAYAQSKLALTMWSQDFASKHPDGPVSVAINPGSLLATKMVREGFGTSGNDLNIGVDILTRAALSEGFKSASGRYFDNDSGQFASPHADAANAAKVASVIAIIEAQTAD
ncbi:SDR family NAD(P)-dependent oxidoreductase [Sulfitobacter sp. S223]|uniref:SDR family NAD(P)-dependent oxidoreductase n=1 Tax=Sulfitobacter sp. S223 TaxID=2867023 RepID=UPI0021A6F293|nr:SDR family NAD(P)-dependent oxidoreductase [Sulfitobacter sp. S223]UWR26889.1 SDR family NAD(P)-dependent oxidoreductase [Sulfitobacter sp. S223]